MSFSKFTLGVKSRLAPLASNWLIVSSGETGRLGLVPLFSARQISSANVARLLSQCSLTSSSSSSQLWTHCRIYYAPAQMVGAKRVFHTSGGLPTTAEGTTGRQSQSNPATDSSSGANANNAAPSKKAMLKQAVKDYGATVIVFHVAISLVSLGLFYLLVSSGLDMVEVLKSFGVGEKIFQSKITQGASTFVVAYAVHKVFAPIRITITLTATPLIVRRLRAAGVLKKPPNPSTPSRNSTS